MKRVFGSSFKKQSDTYHVVINFEENNKKECAKMDKKNQKIYQDLIARAQKAEKTVQNSVLSFNVEVPPPPQPSNQDRYILWTKRNVKKPVIEQSEAVEFLTHKKFKLNEDYEAYQAIDLSKEIKRSEGIPINQEDTTTQFSNVYSNKDNNILRRRSVHSMMSSTSNYLDNNYMENSYSFDSNINDIHNTHFIRNRATTVPIPQRVHSSKETNNILERRSFNIHRPMNETNPKPSAPPMSHAIVYPEYNYPECNKTNNENGDDLYV
jgi:hypothetical protein